MFRISNADLLPAYIHGGALRMNQLPDKLGLLEHSLLNIDALVLVVRERGEELQMLLRHQRLPFVLRKEELKTVYMSKRAQMQIINK